MRECLVDSLNVPTVKVAQMVDVDAVAAGRACRIDSPVPSARWDPSVGAGGRDAVRAGVGVRRDRRAGMYSARTSPGGDADGSSSSVRG